MINYKSLKDHVYDYISAKINDGTIKPKERINENQICENLQISRTPVREALLQLSNEGYLDNLPRRGFIVREIDQERVREIYAILGALEGLAAATAIKKLSSSDLNLMADLVRKMDVSIAKKHYNDYYKLQAQFHEIFILASGNLELQKLITNLKKNFIKQSYYMGSPDEDLFKVLDETNSEHKTILALFNEGDAFKLEAYLREVHWSPKYADLESLS